jgi:predicted lipoprotein with Yx(FWY)xxD motif
VSHRTRAVTAVAATVLVAATATACSDSGKSSSSGSTAATASASAIAPQAAADSSSVTVASKKEKLGTILVTGKNQTLYLFQADKQKNKSTCNSACASAWPPLIVTGKPTAGSGVKANLLSTATRSDGKKQATYNGHPLYRFAGDTKAGQTNGQGQNAFGAKWYVLGTNGKQITSSPSSSSAPSGGGY